MDPPEHKVRDKRPHGLENRPAGDAPRPSGGRGLADAEAREREQALRDLIDTIRAAPVGP